jgi:hypothetical protein
MKYFRNQRRSLGQRIAGVASVGANHVDAAVCHEFLLGDHAQGSSANVIFAGSGYLTQGEIYRTGAIVTFANLLIFMIVGTPWILMVTSS